MSDGQRPLFDPSRTRAAAEAVNSPTERPGLVTPQQVNELVRGAIHRHIPATLHVVGEIGEISRPGSGHVYFTLKDESSELRCVMWRNAAVQLKFQPHGGLQVIATGGLDVYTPRGTYQLAVRKLEPRGIGSLELALRQLKEKLEREGLFAAARKRPLPAFPRRIAIVTSPSGAVLRDIVQTIRRRFPAVELLLLPVRVQGEGAAAEIAAAIARLSVIRDSVGEIDVAIVGRGGGSIEDLWAFNEEVVARAVYACCVPVISAVGHETDFTVCDFVADVRAATPTAAAELATPVLIDLLEKLSDQSLRVRRALTGRIEQARLSLTRFAASSSLAEPTRRLREQSQRLDERTQRLRRVAAERFRGLHAALARAELAIARFGAGAAFAKLRRDVESRLFSFREALLRGLSLGQGRLMRVQARIAEHAPHHDVVNRGERLAESRRRVERAREGLLALARERLQLKIERAGAAAPNSVLARGYAIVRNARNEIVRSLRSIRDGERIEIEVSDGKFRAHADNPRQPGLFD